MRRHTTTGPERTTTRSRRAVRGHRLHVAPSRALPDVRREPVGNFVGRVAPDDPVGTFGDAPRPRRRGAGAFAGDAERQRQGSFGDHDVGYAA